MTSESNACAGAFTLPEVSEADAPESVQVIFSDIRRLSGVPMIALIFRHIATRPEILDEVWMSIGPLFRSGRIQDAAWTIAKVARLVEPLPRFEPAARDILGLAGQDLERVRNTLDAYNRANPVNLLAMLSLLARVQSDAPAVAPQEGGDWRPPPAIPGPLPHMVAPETMDPSLRWLINDFGFGDRSKLDRVVPSLLRHLAHWPRYIAALHNSLLPRFRDQSIAMASTDLRNAMIREAAIVATDMPPLKHFSSTPELLETVSQFSKDTIPMMTVIGHAMRLSLV
jgi:hypothetical protein